MQKIRFFDFMVIHKLNDIFIKIDKMQKIRFFDFIVKDTMLYKI